MNDRRNLRSQLQELSQVAPSAEMTDRALAVTRETLLGASAVDQARLRRFIVHATETALATAAVLIIATVTLLSLFSSSSPTVAYAQVVAQVQQVNTLQYLETRTSYSPQRKLRGPTEVTKVTILGRSRERRELISVAKGDPLPDGSAWTMPEVGAVIISDCARGKYVDLNIKDKTFQVVQGFAALSPDDGTISTTKPAPAPEVDFYKRIREFPAEEAERLPLQEINGRKAVGFRTIETVKRKRGVDTWTRTYWIDPDSNLPVKIEVKFESTHPFMGESEWVLSELIFDAPIDESLLSTEPPEGYKILNGENRN